MSAASEGVRLGWRWVVRADVRAARLLLLQAASIALAVAVGLIALSVWAGSVDRAERGRQQEPRSALGQTPAFKASRADAPYDGDVWSTVFVSDARRDAPRPPGIPEMPRPGESWVSPAVAQAIARDPTSRLRVRGAIAGVIGEAGLQSPDQYFVYTGLDRDRSQDGWRAGGWGSPVDVSGRPTIPPGPFFAILAILIGLPVLLMVRTGAQVADEERTRELALLHMLGVPVRTLVAAAATRAWAFSVVGAMVGLVVACGVVRITSGTAMLGIAWYPPSTLVPALPSAPLLWAACLLPAWWAYARTHAALGSVLVARAGGPRARSPLWLLPMAVGIAALAGVVLPNLVMGSKLSSGTTVTYFLAGTPLALLGALACLGMILRAVARQVARPTRGALPLLGGRRLWWESNGIARSVAAIMIVITGGMIGAAAIADVEHLSSTTSIGDEYTLNLTDTRAGHEALEVPVAVSALRAGTGPHPMWVGTCRALGAMIGTTDQRAAETFARGCRAGTRFEVAEHQVPGTEVLVVPGVGHTTVGVGTVARVWAVPPSRFRGSLTNRQFVVYPGDEAVDGYLSEVMGSDPNVLVTNTSNDSYAPMVPATRKVFLVAMAGGVLIAAALVWITTVDALRRTRLYGARLVVLGASRRLAGQVVALAVGVAAIIAASLALLIGWLSGMTYDIGGGLGVTPGGLGLYVVAGGCVFSGVVVGLSWLLSLRPLGAEVVEVLQRE